MRARSLMNVGTPVQQALGITSGNDIELGVTATGSAQGDAYQIKTGITEFTTVAAATGGRLPAVNDAGDEFWIVNKGANSLSVYPPTGGAINSLATNAAFAVAAGVTAIIKCMSPGTPTFMAR